MGGSPAYQSFMLTAFVIIGAIVIVCVIVVPFIHRHRRKRAKEQMQEKVEKAIADIMEDGIIEGPKGAYVPRRRSGVRTELWPPRDTRPPRANAYNGMPWP